MVDADALALAELGELAAAEDADVAAARGRAGLEVPVPSPPVGALLCWLAGILGARSVVEVGSAAGVTGLWLLKGMDPRGTLTSIESDPNVQSAATDSFAEAGVAGRVRAILGDPIEVLDRLSDRSYELVVAQAVGADHRGLLGHAVRLLRPGGMLVVRDLAVGAPPEVRVRREFTRDLIEHERFTTVVLPLDGGVALATRDDDAEPDGQK